VSKPFKFRYVNELTGAFVIFIVVLLLVGVLLAGRAQHWFEPVYKLRTIFPPEGSFGLQKGAEIDILGTAVGIVDRIDPAEDDRLMAVFKIRGDFAKRYIRTDSVAVIKRKFGVAGDAFVDITVGKGAPIDLTGEAIITCRKDTELLEIVQEVVEQVQQATLPAIAELQKTLEEYRLLASDMRNPEGNLQRILVRVNGIVSQVSSLLVGLEKGEGTAGKLLKDPAIANHVQKILLKVDEAAAQLNQAIRESEVILDNIKKATAVLPEAADTIRGELRDVPGVVLQARTTLHESEKLIEGLQQHWLLRQYMLQDKPLDLLPVDAVQVGGGQEVPR
jgi:phospholipid/cholesterol/gamma-HCH transport system substrate-binding protein